MKYTKPTVKTATTNGVQPRGGCFIYSCSQHTNVQPVKDSVVLSLSKLWRQGGKYLKGAIAGNSNSFFNERRSFIYERLLVVFSNVI